MSNTVRDFRDLNAEHERATLDNVWYQGEVQRGKEGDEPNTIKGPAKRPPRCNDFSRKGRWTVSPSRCQLRYCRGEPVWRDFRVMSHYLWRQRLKPNLPGDTSELTLIVQTEFRCR